MKNIILTTLIGLQLTFSPVFAGAAVKVCEDPITTSFFPVGDERGVSVLTEKESIRKCTVTVEVDGPCAEWKNIKTKTKIDPTEYDSYRTESHAGATGSLFASMAAVQQLDHLWSGWKGYCEKGWKTDFSWAADPMFWAQLVLSTLMEGSEKGGFLSDSSVGQSVNQGVEKASDAMGEAWEGLGKKIGMKLKKGFGKCLVGGSMDMMKVMYDTMAPDETPDCDPVDEMCEEKQDTDESKIITMNQTDYEKMIADHPDAEKYITVLKPAEDAKGVITLKFKTPNEMDGADQKDQEEMEELKAKMKEMQFLFSTGAVAMKMATCGATGGSGAMSTGATTSTSDDGRLSWKNGAGALIDNFPASWGGPYTALIKAGLTIALELVDSFSKVNTCDNKDDAEEAGSRHKKTQEALPYNLCKPIAEKCAEKKLIGHGCMLRGYDYCCYDQILTKTLVIQIKAQLGRDWTHCTGITMEDIKAVSFRKCNDDDFAAGEDGAKMILKTNSSGKVISEVDTKKSFQYKRKCIDFREFQEQLSATIHQDIDFSSFDSIFEDARKSKSSNGF